MKTTIPKAAAMGIGLEVVGDQSIVTLVSRVGDQWEVETEVSTVPTPTPIPPMPEAKPIPGSDNPMLGAIKPVGPGY